MTIEQMKPLAPDEIQYFSWSEESDSGFIIRPEQAIIGDTGTAFKAEEWRNGDIVDVHYGSYDSCDAWTTEQLAQHNTWRAAEEQV